MLSTIYYYTFVFLFLFSLASGALGILAYQHFEGYREKEKAPRKTETLNHTH